jgi:hypothetical protein
VDPEGSRLPKEPPLSPAGMRILALSLALLSPLINLLASSELRSFGGAHWGAFALAAVASALLTTAWGSFNRWRRHRPRPLEMGGFLILVVGASQLVWAIAGSWGAAVIGVVAGFLLAAALTWPDDLLTRGLGPKSQLDS